MATGRTYGGKEFNVIVGIQDLSAAAIGAAPTTSQWVTKNTMRVSTLNDIAWDAGYQRAEISRAGDRSLRAEDVINHYGSGVWTWDFAWAVDNEVGLQNLLNLIYPRSTSNPNASGGMIVPGSPLVDDMAHGVTAGADTCGVVFITNPSTNEDRLMHSAVLQTLTLTMSAGTNGGLLNASGQFMSGYKPVVGAATFETGGTSLVSTSDLQRGLFDCTVHEIGGTDVSVSDFSVTLSNPATRVGYQGDSGEADGYVRAGTLGVTGSITIKADTVAMNFLTAGWQDNVTKNVLIQKDDPNSKDIAFHIPAANMSGHNLSIADEGTFVEIPFTATSGADGTGNIITIKCT